MSLAGKRVALAEGRQLEDLARMLEQEGASVVRCPLVSILDAPDEKPVLEWIEQAIARRFALIVVFTGEGLRRLLDCAERHGKRETFITALGQARTICRGPKPVKVLRDMGVTPSVISRSPTTEGVIEALKQEKLQGVSVGVQLYKEDNPPLLAFLKEAHAVVHTVLPYVYAPASDADRVVDVLRQMAAGSVEAIVFTSSPQIDRLLDVVEERGDRELLTQAMAKTRVAAVGPVISDSLKQHGIRVDICPEQGFVMKNLVQLIKRSL